MNTNSVDPSWRVERCAAMPEPPLTRRCQGRPAGPSRRDRSAAQALDKAGNLGAATIDNAPPARRADLQATQPTEEQLTAALAIDELEVASIAGREAMDRVLYTPHSTRLEHLALAYGWEYTRVTTRSALDQALTAPVGGRQLVEVPLPR